MTIAITSSGIALDGPLVAGEKVAVSVSGLALAAEDNPTLALLARFPDALLASVELTESDTPGTWTGELDTATKQTALFFATARADERRDAALELVAGRVSLARLTVPMANSALCPKPDGSPFASPVYIPVPGPPGQGGDPYDQAPEMDGEASAGSADEYARGDHRHPTDTSRASAADVTAIQNIIPSTATPSNKLATAADIPAAQIQSDWNQNNSAAVDYIKNKPSIPSPSDFVAKTGDQQMQGDLTVSRAGGAPPSDYVMIGNTMGSNATSFIAVNNDGKQLAMSVGVGNDPAIITQKGDLFGAALTPANFGTLALQEGIAPAFSTSSTYAVGDYCTHDGLLYKCTTAVTTAGAWNAADWTAVAVTEEMGADTPLPFDAELEYLQTQADSGVEFPWVQVGDSGEDWSIEMMFTQAPTKNNEICMCSYQTSGTYSYSFSFFQNVMRFFLTDNSSKDLSASSLVENWGAVGVSGSSVLSGSASTSSQRTIKSIKPLPFSVWSDVETDGITRIRRIKFGNVLDAVPVRIGSAGYFYDRISGQLSSKRTGSTNNFIPGPDKATPTITTPGRIVELTPAIRYAFASPTPSVSGTSATVACEDRAINDFTVATGITSLTITPPAAVTGRARDFFCRVTLTDSSLPTVTLTGATIDIGSTEVAGMTQGVNLLMFTEIASGHWLASRRSAS